MIWHFLCLPYGCIQFISTAALLLFDERIATSLHTYFCIVHRNSPYCKLSECALYFAFLYLPLLLLPFFRLCVVEFYWMLCTHFDISSIHCSSHILTVYIFLFDMWNIYWKLMTIIYIFDMSYGCWSVVEESVLLVVWDANEWNYIN